MELMRYEIVFEAEQPIAHHSETFGNEAVAMRKRIRQHGGGFADVPIVTADTCRHGLRDAGARMYLDAAGLLDEGTLTEAALRLLFAGGNMSGKGDGATVSLDAYRELVELIPVIAILGGAAGNRIIPGRCEVEDATLICDESVRFVPEWARAAAGEITTCREHMEEVQRVRMDPSLDPMKRRLLASGEAGKVAARLAAGEKAAADGDAVGQLDAKSSMMPRRFERVCQGSLFFWRVTARCANALDADTFLSCLAAFLYEPIVGGKRGTGHGKLRGIAANRIEMRRPAESVEHVDVTALGKQAGALFREHVAARKERIAEFLRRVDS